MKRSQIAIYIHVYCLFIKSEPVIIDQCSIRKQCSIIQKQHYKTLKKHYTLLGPNIKRTHLFLEAVTQSR